MEKWRFGDGKNSSKAAKAGMGLRNRWLHCREVHSQVLGEGCSPVS
jgi:hypothetical protein